MNNSSKLMFSEGRGTLQQIIDCLSGKNGRLWEEHLSRHIHQGAINAFGWNVSDEFKLDGYEAVEILLSVLKHKSDQPDSFSITMNNIEKFAKKCTFPIREETGVKFLHLSVLELGFKGGARVSEILGALPGLGLTPCKEADALRLICSNHSQFDDIHRMTQDKHAQAPLVLTQNPMFHNLRSAEDPERPFYYQLTSYSYQGRQLGISLTWGEEKDRRGAYPKDMALSEQAGVIVRVR